MEGDNSPGQSLSSFMSYDSVNDTMEMDLDWLSKYTLPMIYSIIAIIGLTANGLVIFIILRFQNMRTIPNIYIFNLALFDFGFLCSLPFHAYYSVKNWPFGHVACILMVGIDGMNQFGSVYIVTAMSIDRYFAICFPLSSMQYRTRKFAKIICVAMWILSFILSLPSSIYARIHENDYGVFCFISYPDNFFLDNTHFTIYSLLLGFLIPVKIIFFCYSTLLYKMRSRNFPAGSDMASGAHRASKRVTVLTMSVVVGFIICWTPYYTTQFVRLLNKDSVQSKAFNIIDALSKSACYSNSCINPFIYTFVGENFKKHFSELFPCVKPSSPFSRFQPARESTQSTLYSRGNLLGSSAIINQHGSLAGSAVPSNSSSVNVALDSIPCNEPLRVYNSNSQTFVFGSKIVEENEIPEITEPNSSENDMKSLEVLPSTDMDSKSVAEQ
ncbi:somatostatin receptor type 2-like [Anneissia japonica]|uniref:somatostatin receptor type 2-like n=1 Tax=Anneissia japonica TaxID=1529436 RepID=UPI001425B98C|nr:somatostatin receptor type 2-like [Anneissia japonica]